MNEPTPSHEHAFWSHHSEERDVSARVTRGHFIGHLERLQEAQDHEGRREAILHPLMLLP